MHTCLFFTIDVTLFNFIWYYYITYYINYIYAEYMFVHDTNDFHLNKCQLPFKQNFLFNILKYIKIYHIQTDIKNI